MMMTIKEKVQHRFLFAAMLSLGGVVGAWAEERSATLAVCGYKGATELTDFPVLVKLPEGLSGFDYAEAAEAGADLSFTDEEGNSLASEIDTWNAAGESYVWVTLPKMAKGTRFVAHWGGGAAVTRKNPWSAYAGVWHMSAADGETNTSEPDATANGVALAPKFIKETYKSQLHPVTDGRVGSAVHTFDERQWKDGNVLVASKYVVTDETKLTFSVWLRAMPTTNAEGQKNPFFIQGGTGWGVQWQPGDMPAQMFQVKACGSSTSPSVAGPMPRFESNWVQMTVVYNGTTATLYANGEKAGSGTVAAIKSGDAAKGFYLGSRIACDHWVYAGDFDEARFYDGVASADRIRAAYDTMSAPCAFVKAAPGSEAIVFSGYAGSTALTDFPALVKLPDALATFDYGSAAADGSDLYFTDAEGNVLASEIDTWNTSGSSFVWVKIPSLTKETTITAHWGGETPAKPATTEVWTPYAGVWHMNKAAALTNTSEPDMTGHGLDAVPLVGAECTTDAIKGELTPKDDGVVGAAVQNRASQQWAASGMALHVPAYQAYMSNVRKLTVSGWVKSYQLYKNPRIFAADNKGSTDWQVQWSPESETNNTGRMYMCGGSETSLRAYLPTPTNWVYVSAVYNGTTATLYANGQKMASGTVTAVPEQTGDVNGFTIGSYNELVHWVWGGEFDEVRLYNGAESADWVQASHATMNAPTAFAHSAKRVPVPTDAIHRLTFDNTLEPAEGTTDIGTPPYNTKGTPNYVGTEAGAALVLASDMTPYGSGLLFGQGVWTALVRARTADIVNGVILSIGGIKNTSVGLVLAANGSAGVSLLKGTNRAPVAEGRVDVAVADATRAYHTYALVTANGTTSLYVDGVWGGSLATPSCSWGWQFGSPSGGIDTSVTAPFQVGVGIAVDDFSFFQRALTSDEMKAYGGCLARAPVATYTATASASGSLAALDWQPAAPGTATANEAAFVTNLVAGLVTTVDAALGVGELEVTGAAGILSLGVETPVAEGGRLVLGAGQKLDLSGWRDNDMTVELYDGATIQNTGAALADSVSQLMGGLVLKKGAAATLYTYHSFGLIGFHYAEVPIDFNGGTLAITGYGSCWLDNVSGRGAGTLFLAAPTTIDKTKGSFPEVAVEVATNLTVNVPLTVKSLTRVGNGVVIPSATATLTVSGEFEAAVVTNAAAFAAVTLSDGATLNLQGTASYTSPTTFGATATVDVTGLKLRSHAKVISWSASPNTRFTFIGAPSNRRLTVAEDGLYAEPNALKIVIR